MFFDALPLWLWTFHGVVRVDRRSHQIVVWRCVEDGCRTLVPSSANHCTVASHGRFDGGGKQSITGQHHRGDSGGRGEE